MARFTRPFSGHELWTRRERAGLSRPKLSQRCTDRGHYVSPQHIYRLENGGYQPSEALALAFADALGCDLDDLLGREQVAS